MPHWQQGTDYDEECVPLTQPPQQAIDGKGHHDSAYTCPGEQDPHREAASFGEPLEQEGNRWKGQQCPADGIYEPCSYEQRLVLMRATDLA